MGLVENFVLLKCRNSEEKTRRLRIGLSAEFLYSMTCVVICSHRRSPLSHFYRVSYRQNWRRSFYRLRQNIKHLRAINLTNPHLARTKSFADQRFNLSVVIDLAIIIETKAQLSSSNGQAAISNTFALPDTS